MFWDGARWIPESGSADRPKPPARSLRLRDLLATLPLLLLVPALIVPFVPAAASTTAHPRVAVRGEAVPGQVVTLVGSGFRAGGILQVRWDRERHRTRLIWVNDRG